MPKPNKLINEQSPYLLQHAYNPVDWYPWNEDAFEKARIENKPIFLSIGYSTCHWCHVMEKESFEDEEVARLMNEAFVSIKVDREERHEIHQVGEAPPQHLAGGLADPQGTAHRIQAKLAPDEIPPRIPSSLASCLVTAPASSWRTLMISL